MGFGERALFMSWEVGRQPGSDSRSDVGERCLPAKNRRRWRRRRRRTCCGPRSRAGLRVLIAGRGGAAESVERPDVSAYLYQWP